MLGRQVGGVTIALALLVSFLLLTGTARVEPGVPASDRLRALLVSDLHDDPTRAVGRLKEWLEARALLDRIDVLLCPGDLSTQPQSVAAEPKAQSEYAARSRAVLRALATIGKPVYFVPGNHDPLPYFNATAAAVEVEGARNVHGRVVMVRPGLAIGGWGGSSAATEDGARVWPSYPFDEPEVGAGQQRLIDAAAEQGASLLLLAHCGPAGIGTSLISATRPDEPCAAGVREHPIDAGSTAMRAALSSPLAQERVVATVAVESRRQRRACRSMPARRPFRRSSCSVAS